MTVLYRKYRPQTVSELDSTEVRKQIGSILSSGRIPHALLLSGPKGIGKTSAARIIAKAINCEERKKTAGVVAAKESKPERQDTFEPCNKCETCRSITEGSNLDVLEIDGASNRGIDEIRDLREKIKLSPSFCRFKVYIIDEVHMLTNEAFNALLKTLEEPPAHAVFILCTTDPQKMPETILSRCQRINFKRATIPDLLVSLKRAAENERFSISDEVLRLVAKKAEGSFRDAQKILDLLSMQGDFSKKGFELLFLPSTFVELSEFVGNLFQKEGKEAILFVNKVAEEGRRLDEFASDLVEYLRMLFLVKAGAGEELVVPLLTAENYEVVMGQSGKIEWGELKRLTELFVAEMDFRDAVIPQLPLEMAIVEWCGQNEKTQPPDIENKREDSGGSAIGGQKKAVEKGERDEEVKRREKTEEVAAGGGGDDRGDIGPGIKNGLADGDKGDGDDFKRICERWGEVLRAVRPYNHSVEALLRAARPYHFDGETLVLEVFYKFHKEKIEKEPSRGLVEKVVSDFIGVGVRIECVLGEKPKTAVNLDNVSEVGTTDDPLVKAAEEIFLN